MTDRIRCRLFLLHLYIDVLSVQWSCASQMSLRSLECLPFTWTFFASPLSYYVNWSIQSMASYSWKQLNFAVILKALCCCLLKITWSHRDVGIITTKRIYRYGNHMHHWVLYIKIVLFDDYARWVDYFAHYSLSIPRDYRKCSLFLLIWW